MKETRRDATERAVSTDLQARTRAVEQQQTVDAMLRTQEGQFSGAIQQLQTELANRDARDREREAEIKRLQDEVQKANQARQSLQDYVDDVTAQLAPVDLSQIPVKDDSMQWDSDFAVRVSDIAGVHFADQTAAPMQTPPIPVKTESMPFPVFPTPPLYQYAQQSAGPPGPP